MRQCSPRTKHLCSTPLLENVPIWSCYGAGFSTNLGTEVVPRKNGEKFSTHDLSSQTYVMRPLVPSSVAAPGEFDTNRDFKQGLRKRLVRWDLTAEKWGEYLESRQNSKTLFR